MSDLLTHWAMFEDSRRLASRDERVDPLFRALIEDGIEYARLGALTRSGNRFMVPILLRARDRWPEAGDEERAALGKKIAFVLGCLAHNACDRVMKQLLSHHAGADWNDAHHQMQQGPGTEEGETGGVGDVSAYYDVHVFRVVYLAGHEEPFSRFLLADNGTEPGRALEGFARSLFQRALLSSHTLIPDLGDVDAWLDRLFALLQTLYLDIERYVSVFECPDPAKIARYQVETVFYRAEDPAIRAARALQRGESVAETTLAEALAIEENASRYAQGVALGVAYLRDASALWRGERDHLETPNWIKAEVGSIDWR